jgi:hypothetical protein
MNYNNDSFKIIASLSNKNEIKKGIIQNNIEVISSIVKCTGEIDFDRISYLINLLKNKTPYSKNKNYLVVNVSGFYQMSAQLSNGNGIKILELNIYDFMNIINENRQLLTKISLSHSQFSRPFNINAVFKYYVIKRFIPGGAININENINTYDVIYIFNGIC